MNLSFKVGSLTKDPEKIKGIDKSLVKLSIIVKDNYTDKDGNRPAQFFNVSVWGALAENCLKYLKKGSKIAVMGKDQTRCWEDTEGVKHYAQEIIAQEIEFISSPKE